MAIVASAREPAASAPRLDIALSKTADAVGIGNIGSATAPCVSTQTGAVLVTDSAAIAAAGWQQI